MREVLLGCTTPADYPRQQAYLSASIGRYATASITPVYSVTTASQETQRKVLYWYDPMTPGQRFNEPGESPFIDMDLVPPYADETQDDGGITISARQQQNFVKYSMS